MRDRRELRHTFEKYYISQNNTRTIWLSCHFVSFQPAYPHSVLFGEQPKVKISRQRVDENPVPKGHSSSVFGAIRSGHLPVSQYPQVARNAC